MIGRIEIRKEIFPQILNAKILFKRKTRHSCIHLNFDDLSGFTRAINRRLHVADYYTCEERLASANEKHVVEQVLGAYKGKQGRISNHAALKSFHCQR